MNENNKDEDYIEKINDNLFVHHISNDTRNKWSNERRLNDKLDKFRHVNGFHLKSQGRAGTIYYIENDKIAEFDYEMSGVPDIDLIVYFEKNTFWVLPKKIPFTNDDKNRIKAALLIWLDDKKIKTSM